MRSGRLSQARRGARARYRTVWCARECPILVASSASVFWSSTQDQDTLLKRDTVKYCSYSNSCTRALNGSVVQLLARRKSNRRGCGEISHLMRRLYDSARLVITEGNGNLPSAIGALLDSVKRERSSTTHPGREFRVMCHRFRCAEDFGFGYFCFEPLVDQPDAACLRMGLLWTNPVFRQRLPSDAWAGSTSRHRKAQLYSAVRRRHPIRLPGPAG